jgi:hypothetical protein
MPKTPLIGTGLRGRVERLLRGDIRQADLHELLFNMRDEAGGSGLVSEIANFLAHPSMRTQGIATQDMRDLFGFLKFRLWLDQSRIVTTDLPASVPDALRANLRRTRKSILRSATGLNKLQAQGVLERVLGRLKPTPGGITKLKINSPQEFAVMQLLASYIKGGSLFNDNDLFEDFCRALQRQGLLQAAEKKNLKQAKPAITLYALIAMHNRVIDLGDGSTAIVTILPDPTDKLAIYAVAEIGNNRKIRVAGWLFETGLPIADYCEIGVAPLSRNPFIGDFGINAARKLYRID